jgi:hypothetical protein
MIDGNAVKEWSQRLRNARQRGETLQTQALLSAFAKIDDAVFREEMIILLEIVASNPTLLARLKTTALAGDPDELGANIIQLNMVR